MTRRDPFRLAIKAPFGRMTIICARVDRLSTPCPHRNSERMRRVSRRQRPLHHHGQTAIGVPKRRFDGALEAVL
jgi:hypothetical protein